MIKRVINPMSLTVLLTLFLCAGVKSQTAPLPDTSGVIHNYPPFEAGIMLGGANTYGDLVDTKFLKLSNTNLSYGLYLRYNADRNFSLRANFWQGQLSGSDLDSEALADRGLTFESPLTEISIVGEWDFLGNRRYDDRGRFRRTISPFVFAGFGAGLTKTQVDFSNLNGDEEKQEEARIDLSNQRDLHITFPMGLGVKADLSRDLLLSVQMGLRPVFNDYLDGVSIVANENRNDWYSIGSIALAYRFGSKDRDKDGFADKNDACPSQAGPQEYMGCPDTDGDGISDQFDSCPDMAGIANANGCPDKDKDGVADLEDACPEVRGSVAAKGCPDRDNDGVVDEEDECPGLQGSPELNGCRDTDEDGLADFEDNCPYEKGMPENAGCPESTATADSNQDSDGDGVIDMNDECPYIPGNPETLGCRDTDKDGVADPNDHCPYKKGTVASDGCPTEGIAQQEMEKPTDSDGDGIPDPQDECPYEVGVPETNGCPGNPEAPTDRDEDGVLDYLDECPDEAGVPENNGCPAEPKDSDGDGILDPQDECPDEAGVPENNGCPTEPKDSDSDGILDPQDECPDEAGVPENNGCPAEPKDSDGDGIADTEDECPYLPGTEALNGCRDTDKDGIADHLDQCPNIEGVADYDGCPIPDRDGDGVLDEADDCPDLAGELNGCPDTDGDGLADKADPCPEKAGKPNGCPDSDRDGLTDDVDDCPDLKGPKERQGCPELSRADKRILQDAEDNISFIAGKYNLLSASRPRLNRIAELMRRYPTYHLRITGHTDNRGDSRANLQLSELRAKACYDHLHKARGIEKDRLSYKGYGDTKPRATNETISGRRRNRRVEFELFDPETVEEGEE